MKKNVLISTLLIFAVVYSKAQNANTALSNLTLPTAVNQGLLPGTDSIISLGTAAKSWKDIYFKGIIYKGSNKFITTIRESTFIGVGAGNKPETAAQNYNTATGYQSLYVNTGRYNTANGNNAMHQGGGTYNTALGASALYYGSGARNAGIGAFALYNGGGADNAATGYRALYSNTSGSFNTATGSQALYNNTVGTGNTAYGYNALFSNIGLVAGSLGFYNTATGYQSLFSNKYGIGNTATGYQALYFDTGGYYNTALGAQALYSSKSSFSNTALGYASLYKNTSGWRNTAVGDGTLFNNITGNENTVLGYRADVNSGNLTNATAIGANALVSASNSIQLGSTAVTSVKAGNNIVIVSDGRFKKNINENVPGLEFIKQLRPVTYNYDIHSLNNYIGVNNNSAKNEQKNAEAAKQMEDAIKNKEKKIYTGFIAQEVEVAANKSGYDFSGVYKPQNNKDAYGLSYADFVVPLVKAVQELSTQNDELKKELEDLKMAVQSLTKSNLQTTSNIITLPGASLEQNTPNPFNQSTTIRYTLPAKFVSAQIVITDQTGKVLKQRSVSTAGNGMLNIQAGSLAVGTYNYSLLVDGRLVDTKKMVLIK